MTDATSTETIVFIAGATRGLGLGFTSQLAAKYPSTIIYAGARDPSSPGSSALIILAQKYPGKIEIVKYLSADEEGNKTIAKQIEAKHGRVDIVIANAAICAHYAPVHETEIDQLKEHFRVNTTGPIVLFKAFYNLLKSSANPKFIPISSVGGSITIVPALQVTHTCYCSTKAALNWVARKIHFENEWLVCFPLSPGTVDTDMLSDLSANDKTGAVEEFKEQTGVQSVEAAASDIVDLIMSSTRESAGGQFVHLGDMTRPPW